MLVICIKCNNRWVSLAIFFITYVKGRLHIGYSVMGLVQYWYSKTILHKIYLKWVAFTEL